MPNTRMQLMPSMLRLLLFKWRALIQQLQGHIQEYTNYSALWSVWNDDDERTDHILFAEYNTQGSGADGADRPDFATVLSASEADEYSIASAVGSDYAEWVHVDYL